MGDKNFVQVASKKNNSYSVAQPSNTYWKSFWKSSEMLESNLGKCKEYVDDLSRKSL